MDKIKFHRQLLIKLTLGTALVLILIEAIANFNTFLRKYENYHYYETAGLIISLPLFLILIINFLFGLINLVKLFIQWRKKQSLKTTAGNLRIAGIGLGITILAWVIIIFMSLFYTNPAMFRDMNLHGHPYNPNY